MVDAETGEALPGPGSAGACPGAVGAYKPLAKSRSAGWVAEGPVVPLEPDAQHNLG